MTWQGRAAASGQIFFDTGDNSLVQFGTLEGDINGTLKDAIVTGIVGYPINGVPTSGLILKFNGSEWTFEVDSSTAHNLLSATHTDTSPNDVARGDIVVGSGASPAWNRLPLGTAEFVLYSDGTDVTYVRLGQPTPFQVGSITAPSWTVTGDLDTGLSVPTQDKLIVSASGQGLFTVDNTAGVPQLTLNAAQIVKVREFDQGSVNNFLTNGDYFAMMPSGGATVFLPGTPASGQVIQVKDKNGNAGPGAPNRIIINGNGKNIDGNSTINMTIVYGSFTLLYNGTQWNII